MSDNIAYVYVIDDYNYKKDMDKALKIANDIDVKHGDIICGTDYHMNSTAIVYKQADEIKIINALNLNEFPKTVFNVKSIISKFIPNPHIFYVELLDEEISMMDQDTFILEVELTKEHEHFISKFVKPDFSNYSYIIDANYLFVSNKNKKYDIKLFKYQKCSLKK